GAQALQLLLVAKLLGPDRLVERAGVDLGVDLLGQVREGVVLPPGFARRLGVEVLVVGKFVGAGFRGFRFAGLLIFAGAVAFLGLRLLGAGVVLAALLAAFLALRLVLFVFRFLALLVLA